MVLSSSIDINVLFIVELTSSLSGKEYVLSVVDGVLRSRNSAKVSVSREISLLLLYWDDSGLASKYRIK